MADRLARIFGTEEDRVNCPFYYKIGACRHGERCSRTHMRPTFSQTVLLPHFYKAPPPDPVTGQAVEDPEHFEDFFEEILDELAKFGEIEQLNVVGNLGDHMFGNVYVKYRKEEEAEECLRGLGGRYYSGRLVVAEYSPVTDFREARCRQYDEGHCTRGGYCNFMHLKKVPRFLRKVLRKKNKKRRDRSPKRDRGRDRRRRRSRSRSRGRRRRSSRSRSPEERKERVDFSRSGSAERRAKIAEWNKARKDKADGKAAEPVPSNDNRSSNSSSSSSSSSTSSSSSSSSEGKDGGR